jgi:two-component system chemotaxis response regulator CheB
MRDGFPIVVLACSSGGLDAVSRVLRPLPAKFGGAIVVIQHLAPHAPSFLPEILASRTVLPVASATDGVHLCPGHVLIAPPGHHLLATPGDALATIPAEGRVPPYRPSADLLLSTLAVSAGPRVIAVVLSGHGNDAAMGAAAVHHFGGLVVVADPTTSAARAMPDAAIAQSDVTDHVIAVDDIAEFLTTRTAPGAVTAF